MFTKIMRLSVSNLALYRLSNTVNKSSNRFFSTIRAHGCYNKLHIIIILRQSLTTARKLRIGQLGI